MTTKTLSERIALLPTDEHHARRTNFEKRAALAKEVAELEATTISLRGTVGVLERELEAALADNKLRVERETEAINLYIEHCRYVGVPLPSEAIVIDNLGHYAVHLKAPVVKPEKWYWSRREDIWQNSDHVPTREAAIAEGFSDIDAGETIYTGVGRPIEASELADVIADQGNIAETVGAWLYDELGPEVDIEWDCTKEAANELETLLTAVTLAWVKRHNLTPNAWRLEHVQAHTKEESDVTPCPTCGARVRTPANDDACSDAWHFPEEA